MTASTPPIYNDTQSDYEQKDNGNALRLPNRLDAERAPAQPLPTPLLASRRSVFAQRIAELGAHLPAPDAALIEAVFAHGLTVQRAAGLMNLDPRTVRRRIRQLITRIRSPAFAFVVVQRDNFSPERATVARACIIEGRSLRVAAIQLGISIHAVRLHKSAIITQAEALASPPDPRLDPRHLGRWRGLLSATAARQYRRKNGA